MSSVNKVMLLGHLGKDPEVRKLNSGSSVVSFSLATSESWKDKSTGERKSKTDWHNIVIFNEGLAGVAEKYLKKGSKVFIEGKLQTREYTDKEGAKRYTTEVVLAQYRGELTLLDSRDGGGDRQDSSSYGGSRDSGNRGSQNNSGQGRDLGRIVEDDLDDSIPF